MAADLEVIASDSIKVDINTKFIEDLQSDNYVYQAMDIVGEMK